MLKPGIVVIDLKLPDKSGQELKSLQALIPHIRCIVLSMHDEYLYAERALKAGARGYITKAAAAAILITAIQRVLSGGIYVSDAVASCMLEQVSGQCGKALQTGVDQLTDRELGLLEMIGQGIPTKLVAEKFCISARTVEAHRALIKDKLSLTDGAALVRFAFQWVENRGKQWLPAASLANQNNGGRFSAAALEIVRR